MVHGINYSKQRIFGEVMKIYTKKGDLGSTTLVDGQSILKSAARLNAYGTVDELNSSLGLLISLLAAKDELEQENKFLRELQGWLFQLGSQLACTNSEMAKKLPTVDEKQISTIENQIDRWDLELPVLKNFILPGGDLAACQTHVCRTIARRAERLCVELNTQEPLAYPAIQFLNRLSDCFFVLARLINHRLGVPTQEWNP